MVVVAVFLRNVLWFLQQRQRLLEVQPDLGVSFAPCVLLLLVVPDEPTLRRTEPLIRAPGERLVTAGTDYQNASALALERFVGRVLAWEVGSYAYSLVGTS